MVKLNFSKEGFFWGLGLLVLAATHLLWVTRVPGFHFDEAWSASFAHRIAFEPRFWPLAGQSPYTNPWSQYWIAIAFRIFGVSLKVYRAAGISMVLGGVVFLSAALVRRGFERAAAFFPWVVAFSLPLVVNHRFGIELTTFHVFCFGAVIFGVTLFEEGRKVLGGEIGRASCRERV